MEPVVDVNFSCRLERPKVHNDTQKDFVVVAHLEAPFFDDSHNRAPVDIILSIDRSGSMSGEKMNLVKETMKFVVKQLTEKDRLEIITYDHEVSKVFNLSRMDKQGKELAHEAIKNISARGSTDLCSGLLEAVKSMLARDQNNKNEVSSILLFTDGLANAGIQSSSGIIEEITKPAPELPCTIHTFGFGSDHDPNMLKAIADKATGTYFFVENKDTIADAFANCLGGLLSVVAQNITLEIEIAQGIVLNKIHTSFKTTVHGNKHIVSIGDIQSEEERDIVCSVELPTVKEGHQNPQQIYSAHLSYFNVITSKQVTKEATASVERTNDLTDVVPEPAVEKQKNRIIAVDAISQAKLLGDQGNYTQGREVVKKAMDTLKSSFTASDPYIQSLLSDLQISYNGLEDRTTYNTYGGYTMASASSAHGQQRSTSATVSYATTNRSKMQSKFTQ